jgi:hypothetical protein
MRDSVHIGGPATDKKGQKPKPTVYLTTAAGGYHHFTEPWQLADWLTEHPAFDHQDILDRFLEHLDANGYRASRPATGGSVDEALALVASFADAKARREGSAA